MDIQNYRKKFSQFWLYVLKAGDAKGSGKKRILREISATKTRRHKKRNTKVERFRVHSLKLETLKYEVCLCHVLV
jgi:hypothetical protein